LLASLVDGFFVENVEGPETNVGEFLFAEVDLRAERGIARVRRRVRDSRCICAARQGHSRAYDSDDWHSLLELLLIWLSLCPGHKSSHDLLHKL
jgi:hypothetical protein